MNKYKIAVAIPVTSDLTNLKKQIQKAVIEGADIIELRMDYWQGDLTNKNIELVKKLALSPTIFTLRSPKEGGQMAITDENRLKLIKKAIELNFEYIDIELSTTVDNKLNLNDLKKNSKSKIIVSYHNFQNADDLNKLKQIRNQMISKKADICKIVIQSNGQEANDNIFQLIKDSSENNQKIIAIAMGNDGIETRIKGPQMGSFLTFASIDDGNKTAPGQINLDDLKKAWTINKIFLHGFRGTGKSLIGKMLAERLGWQSLEMDKELEKRAELTIDQITKGGTDWQKFRQMESNLLKEFAEKDNYKKLVIITGGGCCVNNITKNGTNLTFGEINTKIIKSIEDSGKMISILLTASEEKISQRIKEQELTKFETTRPILNQNTAKITKKQLKQYKENKQEQKNLLVKAITKDALKIYQQRKPLYKQITNYVVDTTQSCPEESLEELLKLIKNLINY